MICPRCGRLLDESSAFGCACTPAVSPHPRLAPHRLTRASLSREMVLIGIAPVHWLACALFALVFSCDGGWFGRRARRLAARRIWLTIAVLFVVFMLLVFGNTESYPLTSEHLAVMVPITCAMTVGYYAMVTSIATVAYLLLLPFKAFSWLDERLSGFGARLQAMIEREASRR